ncbi:MAG: hypothetical protein ABUT39_08355 [Acidobacteriota bacterium]
MPCPTRAKIRTLAILALLAAAPAGAQFSQYTAPGTLLDRGTSKKEQLEKAAENARFRLGPFRVAPWVAIRDAAYVSDVFAGSFGDEGTEAPDEEADFTITAGAGVQGYLPIGPKAFFTVDVLPQYVYWQKQEERRRLNGYYGAGVFGFFNRLNLQATAKRAEEQAIVTPEFEQRIHTRQDLLDGVAELRVGRAVYLFASASSLTFEPLVEDLGDDPRLPPFGDLDREERVLRGGVEYRPDDRYRVAVGVERSEADFTGTARNRSNSGTSPLLEASYESDRLRFLATVARRSLEPEAGSEFAPFDETTGQLRLTLIPRWRLSYSVYASRDLTYSLEQGYSHFTVDRLGGSIGAKIGRSSSVEVFFESGVHDYAASSAVSAPAVPVREDDFQAYGTALRLQLSDRLRLNVGVHRTELDSGVAGFDRSLTVVQSSLEFSAFGGAFTIR